MSLVGSLEDLALGDIFRIVSLARKSGHLLLRSELGDGRIVFSDGLVQAAFQTHIDGAVSKTVHLDEDVTQTRIAELVKLAHEAGCKGVAFYRQAHRGRPMEIRLEEPLCSACGS